MNARIHKKHLKMRLGIKNAGRRDDRVKLMEQTLRKCAIFGVKPRPRAIWSWTHDVMVKSNYNDILDKISFTDRFQQIIQNTKHMIPHYTCIIGQCGVHAANACEAICMDVD